MSVETVTVDVWVTDRDGEPAAGLRAGDFEVLQDGRKVEISHFVEVRGGATHGLGGESSGEAVESKPLLATQSRSGSVDQAPDHHLILYIDRSRIHPAGLGRVSKSIEGLLATEGVAPERVLILQQDSGLTVLAPFGSSGSDLKRALKGFESGGVSGLGAHNEEEQALDAIRSSWDQSRDLAGAGSAGIASAGGAVGTGGGSPGGSGGARGALGGPSSGFGGAPGSEGCGIFLGQAEAIIDGWARSKGQRVATTVEHLNDAVSFLAGLPGIKSLVYVGDGLDTQPAAGLVAYSTSLCPSGSADLLTASLADELSDRVLRLTRHANSNRVTFFAMQSSGLKGSSGDVTGGRRARGSEARASTSYETARRASERSGLDLMASQTGGQVVANQNDLTPGLSRIGRELQNYYSLAYTPPTDTGATVHQIEIRLSQPSLEARYRRGYEEQDASQWLSERTAGALNLGITENPLKARLGMGTLESREEGKLRVPIHLLLPVESITFLPEGDESKAELLVRVMARPTDGNSLATKSQRFRLTQAPGASGFVQLTVDLELEAGDYATALGVLNLATREASFVATTLPVRP